MAAATDGAPPQPPPQVPWPAVLFDPAFKEKVRATRVLAVGAGGIGCELLKTLALSGFEHIEVIDLDTIETSNLNRQFLFRRHHVGASKAAVAGQVVRAFAPTAAITTHQANVKEARFGLDYIGSFDIVLNGLDNMDARRHVNRLCVAAGVPLVESGTAGYVGQVSVHIKGATECYECNPPPTTQKSYPICTLRNTPDKSIHCVVWAKELLFPRLFGKVEVSDLDEQAAQPTPTAALEPAANGDSNGDATAAEAAAAAANGSNGAADAAAAAQEAAAAAEREAAEAASFFRLREGEEPLPYAVRVFERVYEADIQRVLGMEELWKARTPPSPLLLRELLPDLQQPAAAASNGASNGASSSTATAAAIAAAAAAASPSASKALGLGGQGVWSVGEAATVFLACIVKFLVQRREELGSACFDKDDDLAVDFVTAASNLRAACYGIPQQSAFDAKGMAGNIIHAIATTNAIVGGIIVGEALKILSGHAAAACRNSFIFNVPSTSGSRRRGLTSALIKPEVPAGPKPGCLVCGKARLTLAANTATMTLQQLVDKVLRARLAINSPTLRTDGGFGYEEGDDLEEDEVAENAAHLPKALAKLPGGGLTHGTILFVGDQSQAVDLEIIITHQEAFDEEQHPEGFILTGSAPVAAEAAEPEPEQGQAQDGAAAAAAAAAAAGGGSSRKRGRGDADGTEEQQEQAAAGGGGSSAQQEQGQRDAKRSKTDAAAAAAAGTGTVDAPMEPADRGDEEGDVICID